jgi:hypothetical protein
MPDAKTLSPPAAEMPASASGDAIFLFAFGRSADMRELPDQLGAERLFVHRVGSAAALIGVVPLADYCGADGERNLADALWLSPRLRRHAELIEWTMRWSPAFPVPFGALYKSLDSLTAFMQAHEETIAAFLTRVAGKEEWELRASARFDSPEVLERLAYEAWPDWRALPKGVRYMRSCRDRAALVEFGRTDAAAQVRDLVSELRPLTAAVRERDPGRLDPDAGESIARYAFLVDKADVAALRARVQTMSAGAGPDHVSIVLSGPWPAFSFRPDLGASN